MKRFFSLILAITLLLCSCNFGGNDGTGPVADKGEESIVGKWIDNETEQIIEYTAGGYYYEYINESFTTDKTRYMTEDGKIYYYLDGDSPDMSMGIDYEIKNGNLIIAGVLEYRPMDLKTSVEETEQ